MTRATPPGQLRHVTHAWLRGHYSACAPDQTIVRANWNQNEANFLRSTEGAICHLFRVVTTTTWRLHFGGLLSGRMADRLSEYVGGGNSMSEMRPETVFALGAM
jgi:hypothetical protein